MPSQFLNKVLLEHVWSLSHVLWLLSYTSRICRYRSWNYLLFAPLQTKFCQSLVLITSPVPGKVPQQVSMGWSVGGLRKILPARHKPLCTVVAPHPPTANKAKRRKLTTGDQPEPLWWTCVNVDILWDIMHRQNSFLQYIHRTKSR
jgi:hypothetical protein